LFRSFKNKAIASGIFKKTPDIREVTAFQVNGGTSSLMIAIIIHQYH